MTKKPKKSDAKIARDLTIKANDAKSVKGGAIVRGAVSVDGEATHVDHKG